MAFQNPDFTKLSLDAAPARDEAAWKKQLEEEERLAQSAKEESLLRNRVTEEEIAREMGVKPVTVRVCGSRARKHLAQALGEGKGGEE